MLNLLFILYIFLTGSFFVANVFKKKLEETFIFWILGIILILYIFGLFNGLKLGVYAIIGASVLMSGYNIFYFIKHKNKKEYLKKVLSPGTLIFILSFFILYVLNNGRMLTIWDEFTHWGDSVKTMYTINDFVTSPLSGSMFRAYPPSMALFQYFFMVINGSFNEGLLYTSYQLIVISLFLPFLKNVKWKDYKYVIIALLLFIMTPMLFYNNFYTSIYIDAMIGITFGILLGYILQKDKFDLFKVITLCLGLFFLTLLKDVGLLFAILLILSLFINSIKVFKEKKLLVMLKSLVPIVCLIGVVVIAKLTWNYEINVNNISKMFTTDNGLIDFVKLFIGLDNTYRNTVYLNFLNALANEKILTEFIALDFIQILLLFIFLSLYIYKKDKKNRKIFIILFIGLIIYVVGMIIMYCFTFTEYEALNLASYGRYISIYLCGIGVFLGIYFFEERNNKCLALYLLFLVMYMPVNNLFVNHKGMSNDIRNSYEVSVKEIRKYVSENDRVFIIAQNTKGYEYWVFRYSLRPIKINDNFTWSIGKSYNEEDVWTRNIDNDEWMGMLLKDFEYVYCYHCDEQFEDEFGKSFEDATQIQNGKLYKLDKKDELLKAVN